MNKVRVYLIVLINLLLYVWSLRIKSQTLILFLFYCIILLLRARKGGSIKTAVIRNDHNTVWLLNKVFWGEGAYAQIKIVRDRGGKNERNSVFNLLLYTVHWNNTQRQVTRYIVAKSMILSLIVCALRRYVCVYIFFSFTLLYSLGTHTRTLTHTRIYVCVYICFFIAPWLPVLSVNSHKLYSTNFTRFPY